jgi:hypothetical protein
MWCSDRWDQQHDGVVLMVERIYGQGFTYTRGGSGKKEGSKRLGRLGFQVANPFPLPLLI